MKLITKIYFSIGFILLAFVFVTITYLQQSKKVEKSIELVLLSTEIIRTNSNVIRAILNAETGLRGYTLSGKDSFLQPYYQGESDYRKEIELLKKLSKSKPQNLILIEKVEATFKEWNDTVALPRIAAMKILTRVGKSQGVYDSISNKTFDYQKGKRRTDAIRKYIGSLEEEENKNKKVLISKLNQSIQLTKILGAVLTGIALFIGIITAFLLGKTIKKRMVSMKYLAKSLAQGNFDVNIQDPYNDELSSLSADMNTMAIKLQKSFKRLNKINQELDRFAYVVSHDLKAPLRAINNLAEWIIEDIGETTPEINRNLTLMRGRVHRMENLINGILKYTRLGRQKIDKTTFDVTDLLNEVVESLELPPNFKIELPATSFILTTEKILLHQVFSNLISNGIKYNDKSEGYIKVSISSNPSGHEFRVKDNGPGIPAEFQEKIFGIFQTIEARDIKESTGIGLAIVKKIIEERNGSIEVESTPGQGTTFIFTWPIQQSVSVPEKDFVYE